MESDKVLCGECKHLKTDGPCDQWYFYCELDKDEPDRISRWHERAGNKRMRDQLDGSCPEGERRMGGAKALREVLDAWDVKWKQGSSSGKTLVEVDNNHINAEECNDGSVVVQFYSTRLAPEQAADVIIALAGCLQGFEYE